MIASRYIKNNNNYVYPFQIQEKNKIRTIITYKNDSNGTKLRRYHKRLLFKLEKFPSSKYSYAYKKKVCTKDSFKPHMKSILFIKLDIENFFESITLEKFTSLCKKESKKIRSKPLQTCFYNNHISLGYVTSPRISDIYLYKFDKDVEAYLKSRPNLHYSRYSDDILISSEVEDYINLYSLSTFIKRTLQIYGLKINESKFKEYNLNKNTSVSFLGLNLKRNEGIYEITISKKFILKTLDLFDKIYKAKQELEVLRIKLKDGLKIQSENIKNNIKDIFLNEFLNEERIKFRKLKNKIMLVKAEIKSRESYMRFNSPTTYERYIKKYKNKYNKDFRTRF